MQMQTQQRDVLPGAITLWIDPVPRNGNQNMAADELLSRRSEAWLRIYAWERPADFTLRFDYSIPKAVGVTKDVKNNDILQLALPLLSGFSYPIKKFSFTVTLPGQEGVMYPPADQLYLWIHGALATALQQLFVRRQAAAGIVANI